MIARLAALAAAALLVASAPNRAAELQIYADSYPVSFFAERIAGPAAKVTLPLPPEADPATFVPGIDAVSAYQQADLIILNGAGLAQWTTRTSLRRAKTVDSAAALTAEFIETAGITHSHGESGEHAHAATNAHTWLDFTLAAQQADAIAEALSRKTPDQAATFATNLATLKQELAALDAEASAVASLTAGRPLLASHPLYDYFARRYGLTLTSLTWEPGTAPSEAQLTELDAALKAAPASIMLLDAPPTAATLEALAARSITGVLFPIAANRPSGGDFITVMDASLQSLRDALAAGQKP